MTDPTPENPELPKSKAEIHITLHFDGSMEITGPINDKILFAGLLDVARERMFAYHRESSVVRKNGILPFRGKL